MPGAHLAVIKSDFASRGEQQRHGVFRHFFYAVGGIVGDNNAGRGRRFEVYGVHADAVARDDPAFGHLGHGFGGDRPGISIEQSIAIRGLGEEVLGFFGLQRHQVGKSREYFLFHVQRFPDVVGKHYFCFCCHFNSLS
ncbi:MAG: hypothetical protein AABZ67_10625 [Pseudomonadota bacterium]